MNLLQSAIIGVVEGLTEFLPVSSTAHMGFVPQLLGMSDPGPAYSAVVQLGPIVAILAYFRRDLIGYVKGILRTRTPFNLPADDTDARLGWYTILATIPIILAALLLEKKIKGSFRSLEVIAWSLIGFSAVMVAAEWLGKQTKVLERMNLKEAMGIGLAQTLALVPGVSRSGATISGALLQGIDRESATRFSFLLSIPSILLAGLYELYKDVLRSPNLGELAAPIVVGTLVAGISAYAVIAWFLGYMRKHNIYLFVVYRVVVGIILLALLKTGTIQAHPAETAQNPVVAPQTLAQRAP